MYWVDFPHDAYVPEFVNEHPGIIIRAANSLSDTCIILPVTSAQQKAGTHFHQLSKNPNPKGQAEGRIAYVVCDHLYTVNINRLRPRSEENTSELQSLMRISYAVLCLKKNTQKTRT